MKSIALLFLLPSFLIAHTITDKKAAFAQKSSSQDSQVALVNQKLVDLRKQLQICYGRAAILSRDEASAEAYKKLLEEVNQIKNEIIRTEDSWRDSAVTEAKSDEDGYAMWDQEETTLAQLIMEYGSLDFLYIVPQEMAAIKLNMHSNIPIPRESWSNMLEIVLMHNGIGVKKINPYARQLFILKQDLGTVQSIISRPADLAWLQNGSRVFYVFSPPVEQVKTVFQFFERFADAKLTFVHQIGNRIALVAAKEEIEKLVSLYAAVWEGQEGKLSKVVSVSKMHVKEMEKILNAFFGENLERARPPFGRIDQEGLGVFSLGQSNTIVLIGQKETVERAEKLVRDTENQLEDPAEMTVYLYNCRNSDPSDLAKVLEKVYLSLISSNQESAPKETEITYTKQTPSGNAPDGYPPMPPLVVSPASQRPGVTAQVDIEQTSTDHFIADPKSGTLLMTVRRDVLGKIKDLLKKLDVPKRMVQLDVLLFERRLNSQNNFGMNLLKLGKSSNGVRYTPEVGPPVSKDFSAKGVLQFFFHGPSHKYIPRFNIAYNFLMSQEDIQLNAAPSVMTVNQTPATISIVEEISINNGAAPIDTNKGTSFEKSFARAQYGIIINLTPTVHPSEENEEKGLVTLKTDITFDTTKPHPDERPHVFRRHIINEVRVVDGETIILGGLRRKEKQDHEEKIPFLGELPGFGKLFGTTQLTDHETEMFFFITPKIVYDPKEELSQIRAEELKKRPGDIPEFLKKVDEARDKSRNKFFKQSMQMFFKYDR